MSNPNQQNTTNLVPVQAIFDPNGQIVSLIGPGGEYFSPLISFDTIVNSTIDSSPIGQTTPASGAFTTLLASGNTQLQTLSATTTSVNSLTINGSLTAGGSTGTSGQLLQSTGTGVQWINSTNFKLNITDDTSSSLVHYPAVFLTTSGYTTQAYTSSTKLQFTPSTGTLFSTNLALTGNISTINQASFNTSPTGTTVGAGQVFWNNAYGAMSVGMDANVAGLTCQSEFFYIKASSAISIGQVIMFTGAVGASGVLTGAPATGVVEGQYIMGIAAENIPLNGFGYVQAFGVLKGFDTSAFTQGQILYYNPSVTGGLTATKPIAPNPTVYVAAVINSGTGGSGSVFVRVNSSGQLDDLQDVSVTSPVTNQLLQYTGSYWQNVTGLNNVPVGNVTPSTGAFTNVYFGLFDITQSGSKLYFAYNGTNIASLDTLGNLIVLGNVTTHGTP